jgi:hypothetical protein
MTESQIFAWILLSVPEDTGTLQDIIAMADGINHAIPSQHELQTSLGWLQARGLVRKDGRRFGLTETGSQLLSRLRSSARPMMQTWAVVTAELEAITGAPALPDDLTPEEIARAYRDYKRDFWRLYRELKDREKGSDA